MGNLPALLWDRFRIIWEELLGEMLYGYWQIKNNNIRRWITVFCCLEIFSLSFCSLEGRWEHRVLPVFQWLIWTVCVWDIAKFQENFSWGAEDLFMTAKIPTNVSCGHPACVLDPDDTCGITVRWLLQTIPWDLSPWHWGQDTIKITRYQVAYANPWPTCLAILPCARSICHKEELLQQSASGVLSTLLQAVKKRCISL